ncbi:cardiolipin synthase [Serpentinicella sp. ANB-PHB4]|uniref:cardiolipin synthase n=1 Tax=Serpentinicella sp. ANB-PHB4 TaxID=3074076 RepID=UPI00285D6588|nr:cardiolipin synthase [Serpentinicella sp. ANB-PHB4]MDR5658674.1 cardiolipin synthase [Serpentinicella sp. ANB-PHB4]
MIEFFIIVTCLLFATVFFFNFFNVIPQLLIIGFYPYAVALTMVFAVLLFISNFIKGQTGLLIIKIILSVLFILAFITLILIWQNARQPNGYKKKYSDYIRQAEKLVDATGKSKGLEGIRNQGIATMIESSSGLPVTYNNQVSLLTDPKHYFDEMIEEIKKAEHHVHILFYITRDDKIGEKFKNALIQKAKEGVEVRFIYDALGSFKLSKGYRNALEDAGVEIYPFNTVKHSLITGKLNNRIHRKMLIVDGNVAFTGGANLGDEYLGRDENIGQWQDLLIKMKGESVNWLQKIFLADWYYLTDQKLMDKVYYPKSSVEKELPVQVVAGGFDTGWHEIQQKYFSLINAATERLYISTPYFVLNDAILEALQTAALRGVDVKIIVPDKTESFIIDWLNESFFPEILKSGVEIYMYSNGFLHTKAVVVDDEILSVGSSNLNMRSYYLDYELNVLIFNKELCNQMVEAIDRYIDKSTRIKYKDYERLSFTQKIRQIIGRIILPMS